MGYYYRHRLMCDVLEEMRVCCKTLNFGYMLGLIEEIQSLGNRMETALEQKNDIESIDKEWTKKKKELKDLQNKIDNAEQRLSDELKEKD